MQYVATTNRTRLLATLDGMMARARAFLSVRKIAEGDSEFDRYATSLDVPRYQAAISRALRAFNKPDAGITPRASADTEALAKYKGKLDIYGAVAILLRAPEMRDRLEKVGEATIHIGEACEIAEEFRFLGLATLTLNIHGSLNEGPKSKRAQALDRDTRIQIEVAKTLNLHPDWKSHQVENHLLRDQASFGVGKVLAVSTFKSKVKTALATVRRERRGSTNRPIHTKK